MRISDWSSDVCSSDLGAVAATARSPDRAQPCGGTNHRFIALSAAASTRASSHGIHTHAYRQELAALSDGAAQPGSRSARRAAEQEHLPRQARGHDAWSRQLGAQEFDTAVHIRPVVLLFGKKR